MKASEKQVGGEHYLKLKIQPMYYSMANNFNALQHTAIKYISRYNLKGMPFEDLDKAKDCIDKLIEWEKDNGS